MLFLVADDSAVSKRPFIHPALTNWDQVSNYLTVLPTYFFCRWGMPEHFYIECTALADYILSTQVLSKEMDFKQRAKLGSFLKLYKGRSG